MRTKYLLTGENKAVFAQATKTSELETATGSFVASPQEVKARAVEAERDPKSEGDCRSVGLSRENVDR